MPIAPDPFKTSELPVCEKHGYRGHDCVMCYHEKYVVIERRELITALSVLRDILHIAKLDAGEEAAKKMIEKYSLKELPLDKDQT